MDKVRFGVIGVGNMGSQHVQALMEPGEAVLGAVCEKDAAKREKVAKKTGVPVFENHIEMMDSGLVDAVLIAVPHYEHVPMALEAFERGLHVLCEKPVSVTVREGRRINEAAKKYPKLKFGIMFQTRTIPMYAKARELVQAGELGEITRMTWIVTEWFRTHTYYASGGWRATWAGEGGGVLINQCPHNLDQIGWITGLTPERVTAVASIAKTHPIEVEDEVSAIIEFTNGAIGHFVTTTGEAPGSNRLEIAGDRGKLVADGGKLTFRRTRESVQKINRESEKSFINVETWDIDVPLDNAKPQGHKAVLANFVAAVLRGEPLLSPGEDGVKGLELGNAMLMAGLTRTPVTLPMDAGAYDAFLQGLVKTYGGKKKVAGKSGGVVEDMSASFGSKK